MLDKHGPLTRNCRLCTGIPCIRAYAYVVEYMMIQCYYRIRLDKIILVIPEGKI